MDFSEFKRIVLYVVAFITGGFIFCVGAPYLLKQSITYWSQKDCNVIVVGDFHPQSPINVSVVKNGFFWAMAGRSASNFRFNTDVISIDESLVDQASPISETDTKMINDDVKNFLISRIACENVVAIVTASTSQTVSACLETGKMFNIPVLVTMATETDCLKGYDSIGYRLIANNERQVPKIVEWLNDITQRDCDRITPAPEAWIRLRKLVIADSTKNGKAPISDSVDRYVKNRANVFLAARNDTLQNCKTVGILYMSTKYGINLCKELKDTLRASGYKVVAFPITNTNSIIYAMQQPNDNLAIDKWIAICYESEAQNIVAMQERINALNQQNKKPLSANRILFSEASYAHWMSYHRQDTFLYACFDDNLKFSPYGYLYSEVGEDAYHILEYCLNDVETAAKAAIIKRLTTLPSVTSEKTWHRQYAFWNGHSENMLASPSYARFDSLDFGTPKPHQLEFHSK